jgi:hypothetical protein
MTKQEWILRLRRAYIEETTGKDYEKNKYSLSDDELEHSMPQLITGWRR